MLVFVDVTDTWGSTRRTGVQRVVVEAARALVCHPETRLVRFDRRAGEYRPLTAEEQEQLFRLTVPSTTRPPHLLEAWGLYRPLAFLLDLVRRFVWHPWRRLTRNRTEAPLVTPCVLFSAEVVGDPSRTRHLKTLSRQRGFHLVLVVHDLIPWSHPHWSLLHRADFRRYLGLAARAALLLPVSDTTLGELLRWGRTVGVEPRALRVYPGTLLPAPSPEVPIERRFFCVGTIETRKGQRELLAVMEALWNEGEAFEGVFVGTRSNSSATFEASCSRLMAQGRPLRWHESLPQAELDQLFRSSLASVYVSSLEGFGLPVIESLGHGTPCIAANRGAVGEVAAAWGGCLMVDPSQPQTWGEALKTLLHEPSERARLASTIRVDPVRTWEHYGADVWKALQTLETEVAL